MLSFVGKISYVATFVLLYSPGTNHVLAMCLAQQVPSHGFTMCFQGHFLSAILDFKFLYFLVYSMCSGFGNSKPRQVEHYTNQYTNLSIGFNGKLQIYKIIFKI